MLECSEVSSLSFLSCVNFYWGGYFNFWHYFNYLLVLYRLSRISRLILLNYFSCCFYILYYRSLIVCQYLIFYAFGVRLCLDY